MLLLNEGQRPLLDFLRNLTPQALLATTALVMGTKLNFHRFDPGNWFETASFFLCIIFAVLAFFANMNQYLDALINNLAGFSRIARRLARAGVGRRKASLATLRVIFRRRPTLFVDFVASVALINVSWVVILGAALSSARAALR